MKAEKREWNYEVSGSKDIFLTVIIGNGQQGKPMVMMDENILVIGDNGLNQYKVGRADQLIGKKIYISTRVQDVSIKTNHTSVVYIFSGGIKIEEYSNEQPADENGGEVVYRDKFTFL